MQRGFAVFIPGDVDMNQWKLFAPICGALFALAALQACATDEEPATANPALAQEGERQGVITQQMDGCGAWRYRDTAAISCLEQGDLVSRFSGTVATCIDEEHISCKYQLSCAWKAVEVTTSCVEGGGVCNLILGHAPPNQPAAREFPIGEGNRLCVRGASYQSELDDYCNAASRRDTAAAEAKQFCEAQISSVSGTVSCCLSCTSTPPTQGFSPAALAGTTPTPVCTGVEQ
jgi:hypothetical protein